MKSIALGLLILTASTTLADAKSDCQKVLDGFCAAVRKRDAKLVSSIVKTYFAPEFRFVPKKGKPMTRDEWLNLELAQIKLIEKVDLFSFTLGTSMAGKRDGMWTALMSFDGLVKKDTKAPKADHLVFHAPGNVSARKQGKNWLITEVKETNGEAKAHHK